MSRKPISFIFSVIVAIFMSGFVSLLFVSPTWAIDNAPADAAVVNLRTNCTEGGVEVINCFTTIGNVDNWLRNVRRAGPMKPTLVQIGPGTFGDWSCQSSNVTLRGAGRDQTFISGAGQTQAMMISPGCTNLNVQDLTVDGSQASFWGVIVNQNATNAITAWTNVDIVGSAYGWLEWLYPAGTVCPSGMGRHFFFSSRITSIGGFGLTRAYTASCAASWFWGSEITANVVPGNSGNAFALHADKAEVHLYGSNARLILSTDVTAAPLNGNGNSGTYLMAALQGSAIHIHGTGLDVVHAGTGTVDMLYADSVSNSHFHANESGFNIHVTGTGKVNRIAGTGIVETPYSWGASDAPPLSTSPSGVQTLASRNGMDTYIETDCPFSSTANCSAGAGLPVGSQYPRLMVYRNECTGTGVNQGPWFDTVQRNCRN